MAMTKKAKAFAAAVNRDHLYPVDEAIALVKSLATAKFDETIEVSFNLGVDPRHADQMVRGVVTLPKGTGKTVRVGVFARGAKADEAKAAGADVVGAEDLLELVQGGTIDFDRCIATPDMMGLVGRLGKVLGPKGLMPNPKLGTVTPNVAEAVKAAKGGQIEFRVEKAGIIHGGIGKMSFSDDALKAKMQKAVEPYGATIDWALVDQVISEARGVAVPVTRPGLNFASFLAEGRLVQNTLPPGANWDGRDD